MVETAGITGMPRGVAANTVRSGLPGCSEVLAHRRKRQLRDQGNAHSGGDQPLHRLVVVALEGDVWLEPGRVAGADHVARAGARGRRLHPGL